MAASSPSRQPRRACRPRRARRADLAIGLRVMRDSQPPADTANSADGSDTTLRDRRLVAEFCRLLAPSSDSHRSPTDTRQAGPAGARPRPAGAAEEGLTHELTPRLQQTLQRLLAGDAEKEVARRLGVSPNTVHVYVTALYRRFGVNSRGELLARFIRDGEEEPTHLNR